MKKTKENSSKENRINIRRERQKLESLKSKQELKIKFLGLSVLFSTIVITGIGILIAIIAILYETKNIDIALQIISPIVALASLLSTLVLKNQEKRK